ncbi:hypothetical protein ACZ90_46590 [Streptomyces albus subsp. albus]|nr:hypothetical protein ACZ90_46590 [Streptomyces albus subsp. albus]
MSSTEDAPREGIPAHLLRGQKALVTRANSGIGKATAIGLGRAGADVVVNYVAGPEVTMWTGLPVMFRTVFSAMWLPLALAAVGLILRGAGFALRKSSRRLAGRRLYGAVFAVSSLPLLWLALRKPRLGGTLVTRSLRRMTDGCAAFDRDLWVALRRSRRNRRLRGWIGTPDD